MASLKLVFTISSVLLCLVFSNAIVSAKARALRKDHVMRTYEMGAVEDNINLLWRRSIMENAARATTLTSPSVGVDTKWIDDFRPTDPGHSPGAGHSSPTPKDSSNGAPRP
ncbi:unnamed protein product [Sphenostylis stenocarpa]|uniref:Uncharacterized protein n=1 Tax=Sphenostylis stenocarpa TaxID=92480 RepID=A0AA86W0A7_9FABA|nr:unnamed protein product [Sphenostylis stenocarpa]